MTQIRNPLVFLDNIEDSIFQIKKYLDGISYDMYRQDLQLQDATCMRLQIIGENASKLPLSLTDQFSQIQWAKIKAMRNIISHDYYSLDSIIIWDILTIHVTELASIMPQLKDKAATTS